MTDITLQQIEIFLTVAEQLNLSEAAKDLFLNQSAVSRWIQRLENSLNTRLFVRNNRGVELTPDGEFLYAELKPIYARLGTTLHSMRSLYDMPENIIRVGCLDSDEVMEMLKSLVNRFEASHPDVLVKIEPSNFKDLRENLVLGNLDCAITYCLGFGESHILKYKRIEKLPSYFAISAQHPLASYEKLPTEQLANEKLFLLTLAEIRGPEDRAFNLCKSNGFTPKEIVYLPSDLAIEVAVRGMRGFSINGPNFGRRFPDEIKLYKIDDVKPTQYMIIAWREGGCTDITKKFIDSIPDFED